MEPDECFYVQNEPKVRGKHRWNPKRDPPPDLVIEGSIIPSSLDRLAIYASLGVPEIWRYDHESVDFHQLSADGTYRPCQRSPKFPFLSPAALLPFYRQRHAWDDVSLLKAFRASLQDHVPPGWKWSPTTPNNE